MKMTNIPKQIGQAIRLGQLDALHTDLQEQVVGQHQVLRCRRLWWTVYSLNQRITSSIGLPNFIWDADMSISFPSTTPHDDEETALAIHVETCHLLGHMITSKTFV